MTSGGVIIKTRLNVSSSAATLTGAPPIVIPMGQANVLTVGAGMEFATLADALKASSTGQTIAVEAGTYTNDFGTVTHDVSILAVGGLVHEVATKPPPDDKAILTVDANLTITGFTFTGGSDGSPDGNVAGIRQESGNLTAQYCEFSGMQEGLLAGPDPTGTITIDHCYFHNNGTGDGLTHDLYIGAVNTALVENSLFTTANVGHEIKSRAANTTIINNVIADGPAGTASYDIDIPNGGVAVVENNLIEKGANASNYIAIHYGGETNYAWASNSLLVSGNTILNDIPANLPSIAVYNQSAVNNLNVVAQIDNNAFWNYAAGSLTLGAASLSGNTMLASEPGYSTQSPLAGLPQISLGAGAEVLHLTTGNHTITGGARLLQLSDTAGSNTISGGSGGMQVSAAAGWDQIATAAGATDVLSLPGRNDVVTSNGNDQINCSGAYAIIDVFGRSTVNSNAFGTFALNGVGDVLRSSQGGYLSIGAQARAGVIDTGGDLTLTMAAGAVMAVKDSAGAARGLANAVATVSGAVTGTICNAGTLALTTGGSGAAITVSGGGVNITGGGGNDTVVAAGGSDIMTLGAGADSVVFAGGNASVTAGAGADQFVFSGTTAGTVTIDGFQQGEDTLAFMGGASVVSGVVVNGNTFLSLAGGGSAEFVDVTLPGYPAQQSPASGGGGGGPVSGAVTLTTGGHAVLGDTALLTLTDYAGGNTITGGTGGLVMQAAYADVIGTAAGAQDTVTLECYDTLTGAGTDQVTVAGYCNALTEAAPATVSLLGAANVLQGGAAPLRVTDAVGGDTIIGGSGGLTAVLGGTYDSVTTASGATDSVTLGGSSALLSQGTDTISLAAVGDRVTVTGAASVSASAAWAAYVFNGNETVADSGGFAATVGGGTASIQSTGAGGQVTVASGATLSLSQVLGGGGQTAVTVGGGAATVNATGGIWANLAMTVGGGVNVAAGGGPVVVNGTAAAGHAGVDLTAGAGNVTLNGSAGNDVFVGGSGQAQLNLGSGADSITFGNGQESIAAGGSDIFVVNPGCSGTAVITGWTPADSFVAPGGAAVSPVSETQSGGSVWLRFSGGLQVQLVGVSHFP